MAGTTTSRIKASTVFHALSDPTRLDLLNLLAGGEQCVCDLTAALKTGQSRLSFHLKVLKEAGLIKDRPEGRWMYYSLNSDIVEDLEDFVQWFKEASKVVRSASRCG